MSATIPPLVSGGIMLTSRCTNACRHCLYRCSPKQAGAFMPEEMIEAVFAALAAEPHLSGVHLAGGEATLDWDRLAFALRCAKAAGVAVDYLETNAHWCADAEIGRERFAFLAGHGLRAALISASLFHNEFVPLARTRAAIEAACDVFGRRGVIVWTPEVLQIMERHLDPERTHTLDESCELIGVSGRELWHLHGYLRPCGRAAEALATGLPRRPAEAFSPVRCAAALTGTSHFHITPEGCLYTGLCPGIAPGTVRDLHPRMTREDAPIFLTLFETGPAGLLKLAGDAYQTDPAGYVGPCHLCQEVRMAMHKTGSWRELRPESFYGSRPAFRHDCRHGTDRPPRAPAG